MALRTDTPEPKTVTRLIADLDEHLAAGHTSGFEPIPLGFTSFDEAVGGGVRRGDLTIFAGPPGVGKTIAGLQAVRQVAATGRPAIYVCYEHDQAAMLLRLLAQVVASRDDRGRALEILRQHLQATDTRAHSLQELLGLSPVLDAAFSDLQAVGDKVILLSASARDTDLEAITALVDETMATHDLAPLLVVDYLQKVPTDDIDAIARSRRVVEALKDLAMRRDIPVVALASLTAGGLEARKLRLSHLDDTSSIAFEADVVVLLNDKMDAVAKAHLAYGGDVARDYPNWVVWGVAKNRSGPNLVNLEFRKDFTHFRFEPAGRHVSERLADDRFGGDAG